MIDFESARKMLLGRARLATKSEVLPLSLCSGRVLAQDIYSSFDLPAHDLSAMDGLAVRFSDAAPGVEVELQVSQRVPAGVIPRPHVNGECVIIFTGAMLPDGADTVVVQEDVEFLENDFARFVWPKRPETHVRKQGSEMVCGQTVLARGQKIGPAHIGLAASCGLSELPVYCQIKVGICSTGDELVEAGKVPARGQLIDANRPMLKALLASSGVDVIDLGIIPDRLESARDVIQRAAGFCDILISSGGVSVGGEDHMKAAIEAEGELDLWKVAIKPGKPFAFGSVKRPLASHCGAEGTGMTYLGLPGNPVAAWVTFLLLVLPYLRLCQGNEAASQWPIRFYPSAFPFESRDRFEFLRGSINRDGEVDIHPQQGSASLLPACNSQGLVCIPPQAKILKGQLLGFVSYSDLLG